MSRELLKQLAIFFSPWTDSAFNFALQSQIRQYLGRFFNKKSSGFSENNETNDILCLRLLFIKVICTAQVSLSDLKASLKFDVEKKISSEIQIQNYGIDLSEMFNV